MEKASQSEKNLKAIAVKGVSTEERARITATGTGADARRILDIAFKSGVKVREDQALTDLLSAFEVDSPIPLEAIQAVSLILDRVYRENEKTARAQETILPSTDEARSDHSSGYMTDRAGPTSGDKIIDGLAMEVPHTAPSKSPAALPSHSSLQQGLAPDAAPSSKPNKENRS